MVVVRFPAAVSLPRGIRRGLQRLDIDEAIESLRNKNLSGSALPVHASSHLNKGNVTG